jgi:Dolichyl-phosphate-mannose-protein mannosyltransferase
VTTLQRARRADWTASPGALFLLVGAITATGLLLRLPSFGNSLFGDELSSYFIVTGNSLGRVIHILNGHGVDTNPPLYFALSWLVERLGASAQALRLVSLLAGTAAIPMTYLLGRWSVGPRAGLLSASLMAFSPFLIFYTTEARAYALAMLLLLASTLALLKALQANRVGWWAAYAVCSCAAMYSHYTSVFLLVAQASWALLTQPASRRDLVVANVFAAIGFLPWLPVLIKHSHSPGTMVIGFLQPFGPQAVRINLSHWAVGHPFLPLSTVPGPIAIAMVAGGCAVGVVAAILKVRQSTSTGFLPRPSSPCVLVGVLALALPVGLIVYSSLGTSIWDQRNLVASSPALAVAIAALVTSANGRARVAAVCLVTGGFAIGGAELLSSSNQRPDYGAVAAFIGRDGTRTDPVAELPGLTPGPLTEVDAAFAHGGLWTRQRRPVIRIGQASRDAVLRAPPYAELPAPPASALAARAASLARGGKLFVVSFGAAPVAALRTAGRLDPRAAFGPIFGSGVSAFLLGLEFSSLPKFVTALPAGLRPVQIKTFPGFLPVTVYVFSDLRRRAQSAGPRIPRLVRCLDP